MEKTHAGGSGGGGAVVVGVGAVGGEVAGGDWQFWDAFQRNEEKWRKEFTPSQNEQVNVLIVRGMAKEKDLEVPKRRGRDILRHLHAKAPKSRSR